VRAVARFAGTLAVLGVLAGSAQGQDKPNFSGTWKLDPSQSEMGGGMGGRAGGGGAGGGGARQGAGMAAQEVTITQDGTTLRMTMTVMGEARTLTYGIGGGPSTNAATMGRMGGEAVTTTVWDGRRLVTAGTTNVTTPQGAMSIQMREVRTLSADGKTMTVETTRTTQMGENTTKMVYTKG
jgi:hypothetical protein